MGAHGTSDTETIALRQGDHLCLFYDGDPAEQLGPLVPYLREGLAAGEQCVYVADDHTTAQLAEALQGYGIDVAREIDSGTLLIWGRDQWRQPGELDSALKSVQVTQVIDAALRAGFAGIRFAVEITWALGPDIDPDRLAHWEATINTIFKPEIPARIVCQYSRRRLGPAVMRAALASHPAIVLDGTVAANPYYEGPLILTDPNPADPEAARVDWMFQQLRTGLQLARERRERIRAEADLEVAERMRSHMAALYRAAEDARAEAEAQASMLATVQEVSHIVLSDLELNRIVQQVTDAARVAIGAQFGAFFYNVVDPDAHEGGIAGGYLLYSLSGVDRSHFEQFPLPRNTALFDPTSIGEGVVRIDNVRRDPRYGHTPPHFGIPEGHLPVTSYLAVPVVARNGEVLGGLFFGHEAEAVFTERHASIVMAIADQAAMAIENARLYEESQRSVRLREQFLGVAAHELKTPLTGLTGYALLLARKLERGGIDPSELHSLIDPMVTSSQRLEHLVNDLLDISRVQHGRLELEPERGDFTALVERVLTRFEEDPLRKAEHAIVFDSPGPVPGCWDMERMDQVVTNLISNALKYSPHGGEVHITMRCEGESMRLEVSDQGIGIPREEQALVFQPFSRGHAQKSAIPGNGLGLYISSEIIARHGGNITVESVSGRGSTFTVEVPLDCTPIIAAALDAQ